jgi:hypothetical protein
MVNGKLNFHPVEIIGNEVIAAAQTTNGALCLLHCRVGLGGQLEFTARVNSQETADHLVTSLYTSLTN